MDKSSIIKKIIIALITVLFLVYLVYIIIGANFNSIKTETATEMTVSDSISVSGYFIREENVLQYKGDGVISYTVSESAKVANKETVAEVFKSAEDAAAQEEIDKLKLRIETLENLQKSADMISLSPDELDESVCANLFKMVQQVQDNGILEVGTTVDEVLYSLNERQLVTGKTKSFSDKIKELKGLLAELEAEHQKSKGQITSNTAGYFVSFTDGYEGMATIESIDSIYPKQLEELMQASPKTIESATVGKTISNVFWYIACPVTYEQALALKASNYVTVSLPFASVEEIPVSVVSINQETKTSDGVAILRGDYMSEELAAARNESVIINIETYTGIYINKKAVHEQELTKTITDENGNETKVTETVMGVYVSQGNELQFKQIAVLYSGEDYLICSSDPKSDEEDGKDINIFSYDYPILKLYDKVVVEGVDLYDGKLVAGT